MSMERIYPDSIVLNEATGDQTLQLHLERYQFAGKNLRPGYLADIACGAGYGSFLLASQYGQSLQGIQAVDIDAETISFAQARYAHPLIQFITSDALGFTSAVPLHNIVSLETIEHLADPRSFVNHVAAQLASGGCFIASAPVTPSMDANPYHLQDFTVASFKKLFTDAGLKEVTSFMQVQHYNPFPLLQRKEERSKDLRKNVPGYYMKHPGKFFLRLRSLFTDGFTNKYLVVVFEKL